jgi:hypothetical protein
VRVRIIRWVPEFVMEIGVNEDERGDFSIVESV